MPSLNPCLRAMERLPVEKIQAAAASAEGDCLLGVIFDERRVVVYHDKCDSLVGGALQGAGARWLRSTGKNGRNWNLLGGWGLVVGLTSQRQFGRCPAATCRLPAISDANCAKRQLFHRANCSSRPAKDIHRLVRPAAGFWLARSYNEEAEREQARHTGRLPEEPNLAVRRIRSGVPQRIHPKVGFLR